MCQAFPGPRCYADSSKQLAATTAKLERARTAQVTYGQRMDAAADAKNFSDYAKAKKRYEASKVTITDLEKKASYIQRDVDGTKTGAKQLKEAMAAATSPAELRVLQHRERAAAGLRYGREKALYRKNNSYASTGAARPIFYIKGEVELAA